MIFQNYKLSKHEIMVSAMGNLTKESLIPINKYLLEPVGVRGEDILMITSPARVMIMIIRCILPDALTTGISNPLTDQQLLVEEMVIGSALFCCLFKKIIQKEDGPKTSMA